MKSNVYCVVMAGGVGSRFWPMSRQNMPKQFLDILNSGSSLIQLTHDRFKSICTDDRFLVVTSNEYVDLTKQHLGGLNPEQILAEPMRRNTAPCIAYAAHRLYQKDPDAVMVITPADHVILKQNAFEEALKTGIEHAEKTGHLVTLGIRPTRPDSGYGYIQFYRDSEYEAQSLKRVKTFTEKPSVELALQFLQSGDFYWNSGMFIWKVSAILEAFSQYLPDMANNFDAVRDQLGTANEVSAIQQVYAQCENISIDYGVMEKAENVDVVLADDIGWSDLGTWGSLYEHLDKGPRNNVLLGKEIKAYDTNDSIVMVPKDKLAVVQGLTNYIVIDTKDVLLICQKDEEQKIKSIVQDLKQEKKNRYL